MLHLQSNHFFAEQLRGSIRRHDPALSFPETVSSVVLTETTGIEVRSHPKEAANNTDLDSFCLLVTIGRCLFRNLNGAICQVAARVHCCHAVQDFQSRLRHAAVVFLPDVFPSQLTQGVLSNPQTLSYPCPATVRR